jgi:hypothetical protein
MSTPAELAHNQPAFSTAADLVHTRRTCPQPPAFSTAVCVVPPDLPAAAGLSTAACVVHTRRTCPHTGIVQTHGLVHRHQPVNSRLRRPHPPNLPTHRRRPDRGAVPGLVHSRRTLPAPTGPVHSRRACPHPSAAWSTAADPVRKPDGVVHRSTALSTGQPAATQNCRSLPVRWKSGAGGQTPQVSVSGTGAPVSVPNFPTT